MKKNNPASARVEVCPFDGLPCEFVDSCDDVMILYWESQGWTGFDTENGEHCSRAIASTK
jgi:hypothetical protein